MPSTGWKTSATKRNRSAYSYITRLFTATGFPDTCNLSLYEDKTFPLPDNFFGDYEGRPAAAAQEMGIVKGYGHDIRPQDAAPRQGLTPALTL